MPTVESPAGVPAPVEMPTPSAPVDPVPVVALPEQRAPGVYEVDRAGRYWRTQDGVVVDGELHPMTFEAGDETYVRANGYKYTISKAKIVTRVARSA